MLYHSQPHLFVAHDDIAPFVRTAPKRFCLNVLKYQHSRRKVLVHLGLFISVSHGGMHRPKTNTYFNKKM